MADLTDAQLTALGAACELTAAFVASDELRSLLAEVRRGRRLTDRALRVLNDAEDVSVITDLIVLFTKETPDADG